MAKTKPEELTDVFRGSVARAEGYVTRAQLRSTRFRRLFQDVYAPAHLPVTHELRCRGAALLVPKEAVLTGRSAATVHGVDLAKPYDPIEFVVPEKSRFGPIKGIHVRRTAVKPKESRPWYGIRIARPTRIALDLLLRHSPRTRGWVRRLRIAVPDLDAFIRSEMVTIRKFERKLRRSRNRGIRLARQAYALSDSRAESLPESELRVILTVGGFNPTPQFKIIRRGKEVARLDLALPDSKTAIEYDGRWHLEPTQMAHDKARRKRLESEGWTNVVITAEQLAEDHSAIVETVHVAHRRRSSAI